MASADVRALASQLPGEIHQARRPFFSPCGRRLSPSGAQFRHSDLRSGGRMISELGYQKRNPNRAAFRRWFSDLKRQNAMLVGMPDSPISLFLMVNTFETGGSERQFTVLAQNLAPPQFQVHVGCINPRGPLAHNFPAAPQFPLGGSLYGWQSLRARLNLNRHLRHHQVQVAQAFDFYANLTLIPAAKLARVPVIIGSHRQLGDLMTRAQFRAQTAAFRWCDAVVCNSQAAADRLLA